MSRRNVDLGSGSVGKLRFSLAVPTITSQIVNMLYNLVDRVYIGHMQPVETVGKLALTGVGVCLPIIMVISAFAALMAFGGAPRASIAEGRGDLKESERIMGNSFTMLVAVSVVLTVVFLVFAEPMLRIFGAVVVKQFVVGTDLSIYFVHVHLYNARKSIVVRVTCLTSLEENIRVLCRTFLGRVVRV